ncbi:hypothetical protein ES708_21685 [subsurface metagenome]
MKKNHKRRVFILDKVPYVLFGAILIIAIIIFLPVRSCMPLNFFSGVQEETENESEYPLFIASPTNDKVFIINKNETVPVEIKAKEVESTNYTIIVLINDSEIKSFTSPPYEYNWNPEISGEYEIIAQLVDENGITLSSSNKVAFTVEYEVKTAENNVISVDIKEKKNEILSRPIFRTQRSQNTIPPGLPIFSYKCYIPPVIDGSIQEWEKFDRFSEFMPTIRPENYASRDDIDGTFYSCWDDDNFYFAVQVVDDVFSQKYTGNQLYKGDSITIVFDTELEEDMSISFYTGDDYRIDFSPGNFSGTFEESFMYWPSNTPPRGANITSTRLANGGYMIEASIPWYNFPNYNPYDEDVLGFTVSILDTDYLESTELVISSSKKFEFNDVSNLGIIVLIDAGNIQEEEVVEE